MDFWEEDDGDSDLYRRRRDSEPHRAPLLKLLALTGTLLGLAACLILPGVLGLTLGLVVRVLAARDLARMASGQMDMRGRKDVQEAQALAGYAIAINGLVSASCGLWPLLWWLASRFG